MADPTDPSSEPTSSSSETKDSSHHLKSELESRHIKLPRFRWFLIGGAVLVMLIWVVPTLLQAITALDIEIKHPYAWISFFVTFDAVVPVLPSESLLHVASVRAVDGDLNLWVLVLAAGLGAVVGDSLLYWIARKVAHTYFKHKIDSAKKNEKVKVALSVFGDSAGLLVILGRYVPGVRFVVNATMGITKYPYPRFLLYSTIGGFTWSAYTLLISFAVGRVLEDYPVMSFVTGIVFTSAIMALLFFPLKHRYAQEQKQQSSDADAGGTSDAATGQAAS